MKFLKGISSSKIDQEVTRTLQDVDLVDKANTPAIHLSGGQKRKLSVGIAVIGDPKVSNCYSTIFCIKNIFIY